METTTPGPEQGFPPLQVPSKSDRSCESQELVEVLKAAGEAQQVRTRPPPPDLRSTQYETVLFLAWTSQAALYQQIWLVKAASEYALSSGCVGCAAPECFRL